MLRFTSLVLLAACTSAPARPTTPAPLANRGGDTIFELARVTIPGPEGRHSAQHSRTELAGRLALGTRGATLTLESRTQVGYILCPHDRSRWPQHQACVDTPPDRTEYDSTLVLAGTFERDGEYLHLRLARTVQPDRARPPVTIELDLACTEAPAGPLTCTVTRSEHWMGLTYRVPALVFERTRAPEAPGREPPPAHAPRHAAL